MIIRGLVACAAAGILLAGCTSTEAGGARPAPGEGEPGSSTAPPPPSGGPESGTTSPPKSGQPTVAVPPRPKDLDLAGVEPCSLFTEQQLNELGVTSKPDSRVTTDHRKAPACSLDVGPAADAVSIQVVLGTNEGIEAWLTGKRNVTAKLDSLEGYPAVHYYLRGGTGAECVTGVDVADGQLLYAELSLPGEGWTQEKLCSTTDGAAKAALATLRTLR